MIPAGYPFEVTLGQGKVVQGWEVSLLTVAVGETVHLRLSADYGYGDQGSKGNSKDDSIPPGATLEFEVELVSIVGGARTTRADEDLARLTLLRAEREAAAASAAEAKAGKEAAKTEVRNRERIASGSHCKGHCFPSPLHWVLTK